MIRREFFKSPIALAVMLGRGPTAALASPAEEFPKSPGLTSYVSDFIMNAKYEDIPEDVITLGKKTILDGFGLALAGSASTASPRMRKYIETLGFSGRQASIIGTRMKAPPRFAALANGVSIHADDYDDTGSSLHVAAPVLSPSFAVCEAEQRSGKDLMLAFHVGVEVASKIGDAISSRHNEEGFHTTGTIGSFGSAAACARLRGLNARQTAYALGVAASQAGGIRANFGSMTKPFHAGHAAENGVAAVDLAGLGWTAADDILEAPLGFYRAAGGSFDPALIKDRLGNPWMFRSPGDLIKRFPCGTIQQSVMDEMLNLIQRNNIQAADVAKIDVGGNQSNFNTLFRHRPTTGLEAKFSMEFSVAIMLLERKAGLDQFTDAVVQRPDVQEMIRRVNFYVDPDSARKPSTTEAFLAVLVDSSLIKIQMKNGSVLTSRTGPAKGSPQNPMTYEEVADKFLGNAEFAKWPAQKSKLLIEAVKGLEKEPNLRRITSALTT